MTIPDRRPADLAEPCEHPFIGCPCRQPGDAQGPLVAGGEFVLGFKAFHDAAPDLTGFPLEPESGGIPDFSAMRTSTGRMIACNLVGQGWRLLSWSDDGGRWLFTNGRAEQIA